MKKVLKIIAYLLIFLIIGLYTAFVIFSAPSSDKAILAKFENASITPKIERRTYHSFSYRLLSVIHNPKLPTLIFIHGSIGSCADFKEYMQDPDLLKKYNMVAYDRIGYNYNNEDHVQESIAFERDLLDDLISSLNTNTVILTGYSYGGPIALATKHQVKKIILLAPAVYSKVEPTPWAVNFYKWPLTRWLVPKIWKEASREKLSHPKDLENFENKWKETTNTILSIHGTSDWIVPHSNSEFLLKEFPSEQFQLLDIQDTGHELIWTQFSFIKQQLLNI